MKKQSRIRWLPLLLALVMVFALLCAACGKNGGETQPEPEPEPADTTPVEPVTPDEPEEPEEPAEPSPAEIAEMSERAMDNFLAKILAGHYVMEAAGVIRTSAVSDDLVLFDYADDELYSDFAVMSLNNEVFQGFLEDDGVRDVSFLTVGNALETASVRLPSRWLDEEVSQGNIYNLFYNDTEDPLKFVSYDTNVQDMLRTSVGYGQIALNYMHEVYLTLDQEDPTVAHVTCQVDDNETARYYFDDIDLVITFGGAESDARVDAWMKDPVYPEARTEWEYGDFFMFNSVFMTGMEDPLVPFPASASYAMQLNDETFYMDDEILIRDPHGKQEDVDAYIELLKSAGFAETESEDGICYRRLLRDETKCYASAYVDYDDGLNIEVVKYYEFPAYEGMDEINGAVTAAGYPALSATEALTDLHATDTRFEQTESWLYFYDYDISLYVYGKYADPDQAQAYLDAYAEELLQNGFHPVHADPDDEESEIIYYDSEDGSASFRYHFEDDGENLILLFKAEKCLTADEGNAILTEAGFPAVDADAFTNGRNHKQFYKVMYDRDFTSAISFTLHYDTPEEAEAYLDSYVALLEEADFYRVPGNAAFSRKENGYINEEKGMSVAFDYYPEDYGGSGIYFEFKSGMDFTNDEPIEEEDTHPILGKTHEDVVLDAIYGSHPLAWDEVF